MILASGTSNVVPDSNTMSGFRLAITYIGADTPLIVTTHQWLKKGVEKEKRV